MQRIGLVLNLTDAVPVTWLQTFVNADCAPQRLTALLNLLKPLNTEKVI